MNVVVMEGLTKYYGDLCAVDEFDLEVGNEIFGLLGPNGAGKSTIVKMLTTLIKPSKGRAFVCGHDVVKDPGGVRKCISYVPQEMAVDIKLTGRENVMLYAGLYHVKDRVKKVDQALSLMDLSDRADEPVRGYSGGMRRRLELAQALVHEPSVLFLDEPTLGLDVAARKKIWSHISSLKQAGMTVFMTTHYMDEADRYCDRVAIIDRGRIAAIGTPDELKSEVGKKIITARISGPSPGLDLSGFHVLSRDDGEIRLSSGNGTESVSMISEALNNQCREVVSMSVRDPTLDDVFLRKVTTREEEGSFNGKKYRLMLRRR